MRPITPCPRRAGRASLRVATVSLALLLPGAGPTTGRTSAADADGSAGISAGDAATVATVGEIVYTTADLERAMRRRAGGRIDPDEPAERVRARVVAELVDEGLLRTEIERRGISASAREIDDRLAALSQDLATRKSSLDAFLAEQKLDRDSLRRRLGIDIAVARLAAALLTPEAMQRAYDAHHREFDGTRVRVAHIILRPDGSEGPRAAAALEARAGRIRDSIVAGEVSFADAATRHSAGPSRHRGGDLGFIPRHGLLSEEFAHACFELEPGEVSRPILTPYGVHLITLLDVDEGSAGPEQLRPQLERLAAQDEIRRLLEECRGRTTVTIEPGYETLEERAPPTAP